MVHASTGKLIVVEGLEGAGKTTAIHTVIELLSKRNIPWITVREPGGTAIGETLRSIIKNPQYRDVLDDKSELLLMYAARVQLLEEVIKPTLKQGSWVIADRFELSTFAYQGEARDLDLVMIKQLSAFCLQGFKPDLCIYLDINPEVGLQRVALRGDFDRIEQQSFDFFCKVYEGYKKQLQVNPNIVCINAAAPLKEVKANIETVLNGFIEQL